MSLKVVFYIALFINVCVGTDRKDITNVDIIVSNHLDVGYTGLITDVVNKYFDDIIPSIRNYGDIINNLDYLNITWKYMLQPYIVSLYLECPPNAGLNCPNEIEKRLFLNMIQEQRVYWNGFPFNSQLETYDSSMIEYGIWLSREYLPNMLRDRYNITVIRPNTLSQRDVPGLTRSIIPILLDNGIKAISIGCNEWSAPPDMPRIFRWYDDISKREIVTMINPGDYGGFTPYSTPFIDNYNDTILFAWNGDNHIFTLDEILPGIAFIQDEFPNAWVHCNTFNDFVDKLLDNVEAYYSLPIYTQEMGDTWTYGPPSDPVKLQKFRIMQRERFRCIQSGQCLLDANNYDFNNFSRFILKNGEHTFGLAVQSMSTSQKVWSNPELVNEIENTNHCDRIIYSWNEQRQWGIDYALQALTLTNNPINMELYQNITNEFAKIESNLKAPWLWNNIVSSDYALVDPNDNYIVTLYNNKTYNISFNSTNGALKKLFNIETQMNYIGNINEMNGFTHFGLGLFLYESRTEQDFIDWFQKQYNYGGWGIPFYGCEIDFCKNNLSQYANFTEHLNIESHLIGLYKHKTLDIFITELNLGSQQDNIKTNYGGPNTIYGIFNFSSIFYENRQMNKNDGFSIQFTWINKTYTKIPESLMFVFNPNIQCNSMYANKLDEDINIQNVILNGSYHLHSINPNINNNLVTCNFNSNKNSISFQSIDSALSTYIPNGFTEYTTFPTPLNITSDLSKGVAFVAFDNTWNTNYPLWYPFNNNDNNSTFRFNIFLG